MGTGVCKGPFGKDTATVWSRPLCLPHSGKGCFSPHLSTQARCLLAPFFYVIKLLDPDDVRSLGLSLARNVTASYTSVGCQNSQDPLSHSKMRSPKSREEPICSVLWVLIGQTFNIILGHCSLCSSWGAARLSQQYINRKHSSLFRIWVVLLFT